MAMESFGKKKLSLRDTLKKVGQAAYISSALYGANAAGNNLREAQNPAQAPSVAMENEVSDPGRIESKNNSGIGGKYENTPISNNIEDRRTGSMVEENTVIIPYDQVNYPKSVNNDSIQIPIENHGSLTSTTPAHEHVPHKHKGRHDSSHEHPHRKDKHTGK
jgi:hypothetical protein